jgi:hypothetical protein
MPTLTGCIGDDQAATDGGDQADPVMDTVVEDTATESASSTHHQPKPTSTETSPRETFSMNVEPFSERERNRKILPLPNTRPTEPNIELRPSENYAFGESLGDAAGNPADISADCSVWYDESAFHVQATVMDDTHHAIPGGNMWKGDCIQIAVASGGTYGPEYGFAHTESPDSVWRWHEGQERLGPDAASLKTSRTNTETRYEITVPWKALLEEVPRPGMTIPFSLLVNDNDGDGRETFLGWAPPSIGLQKQAEDLGLATLSIEEGTPIPWSGGITSGHKALEVGEYGQWTGQIENYDDQAHQFTLDIEPFGHARTIEVPGQNSGVFEIRDKFDTEGEKTMEITIRNEDNDTTQLDEYDVLVFE